MSFESAATKNKKFIPLFATFLAVLMASTLLSAAVAPDTGSAGSQTTAFLNISAPLVVQPCANLTFGGSMINASNVSQPVGSYNVTAKFNNTLNSSAVITAGNFQFNFSAPCTTEGLSGNFSLENLTVYTNSSDNHSKSINFFITNSSNASVVVLAQKPPFGLGSNNTVNITYFNGSTALNANIPFVQVYNSSGQLEPSHVVAYNLSSTTNAAGIIQYNLSVDTTASGTYTLVVDRGLASFSFKTQGAYGATFLTQTTTGESRSSFGSGTTISLIGKTRYANGTAYDLASGDYVTAHITLPNTTVFDKNLSVTSASSSPGTTNTTFTGTDLPGAYKVRLTAHLQSKDYDTFGQFEVRTGFARLDAGSDFFQHLGDKSVILPSQSVRFNVLLYNNTDDSLVGGTANGGAGALNCSAVVLNGFTNLATNANTTWVGTPTMGTVAYQGANNVCSITVGVPASQADYLVNATLVDPLNSSLSIPATGIVQVRTYGLNLHICPATSDFMPCGFVPFFKKGDNATFEFGVDNFTSSLHLARSAILNITSISVNSFSFGTGSATSATNWTANSTYFLVYPQTDSNVVRLVLLLPSNESTGPHQVQLTVNTTVGSLKSTEFFMVKGTSIEAHGGPVSGSSFNPQISCNGTFSFLLKAVDLTTNQAVQGVSVNGIKSSRHMMSGKVLDTTALTNVSTNSTDSSGNAVFNVTFNTSKSFLSGPYDMILNVSYQGQEDEAFAGFMCGSGSFQLFKPEGFGGENSGGSGGGPGPQGGFGQSGITGTPVGQPPRAGSTDTLVLPFQNVGFGGSSQPGGSSSFNGTLGVTGIKYFNSGSGSERSVAAAGPLVFNVSAGAVSIRVSPGNFSLNGWPQGFIQFQVNFTNGTVGVGTGPSATGQLSGFESSPFRIFVNFSNVPSSVAVGQNVTIRFNVSTNVSFTGNNFTVRAQSMTSGVQTPVTLVSATQLADYWNTSADDLVFPPNMETWNVTVTVPTLASGPINFIYTVNNSKGITNDFVVPETVTGLEVRPLTGLIMMADAVCTPYDDIGQNGSLDSCSALKFQGGSPGLPFAPTGIANFATQMNFTEFNKTYGAASKSGTVCYKSALNWTQGFGFGGPTTSLSSTTYLAVIDNTTSGVYDTLVLNTTTNNVTVIYLPNIATTHRGLNRTNVNWTDIFALRTEGCGIIALANSSESPANTQQRVGLGRYPVNSKFYLGYKAVRGSTPLVGASVDLLGFGNMSLDGMTFSNMLTPSQYVVRAGNTSQVGIAFVEANVTVPANVLAFWKVNATLGGVLVQAFAKMQQDQYSYGGGGGNQIEIASFNAFCMSTSPSMLSQPNQNVSINCTSTYFNNTSVTGANFTLQARDFNANPPTVTTLRLFNVTTGAIMSGVLSDATGTAYINFTMPGNWTQGHFYQLIGSAVLGSANQQVFAGGMGYNGGSGNFGPGP